MKPTLFDLWNGNLKPIEDFSKGVPEIKELEKLIDLNCNKLIDTFTDKQKEIFESCRMG